MSLLVTLECPFGDHFKTVPMAVVCAAIEADEPLPCPKCGAPIEVTMDLATKVAIPRAPILRNMREQPPTLTVGRPMAIRVLHARRSGPLP